MKGFQINKILIPADFSATGSIAAFMARLNRASLYLMHSIEIAETSFTIYNPVSARRDLQQIEEMADVQLNNLADKLRKEYGITVFTICTRGKVPAEVTLMVKENDIDIVVMGTHGTGWVNEFFLGSNAHKIVTLCKCPVITVQAHAGKPGMSTIVLPIYDSMHSRQKVDYTIYLAKVYAAKIHLVGLSDKNSDQVKLKQKVASVEKVIAHAGIPFQTKIIKADNPASKVLKYAEKIETDLIVVLTNHESELSGMFLGAFAKQIVNHSRVPVMSIRPVEGTYEALALSAAIPF